MKKKIRIEKIEVKKLFDRFNYDINLKNGHDVSILIAPNGCGKTTIFNIISFMLNPTIKGFSDIATIPFEECSLTLSNRRKLKLVRKKLNSDLKINHLEEYARFFLKKAGVGSLNAYMDALIHTELILSIGGKSINVGNAVKNLLTYEHLPFGDAGCVRLISEIPYYENNNNDAIKLDSVNKIQKFLEDNSCDIVVNYTKADRLHSKLGSLASYSALNEDKDKDEDAIQIAVNHTQEIFRDLREQYNVLQSKAKDQLPKEYLAADENNPVYSEKEFINKWTKYVSDIEKYSNLGLINMADKILSNKDLKAAYHSKGAFLCTYLSVFEKTLEPYEKEYERFKILVDILNERNRITGKVFTFGKDGIVLTVNGKSLPLSCLSSGEKNDFIMFYSLIFSSDKNELVLIDEPEISLHIEWQETYLDYLTKICEMNGLQAIVATHSPNIVNGHFELYAEKGLAYD